MIRKGRLAPLPERESAGVRMVVARSLPISRAAAEHSITSQNLLKPTSLCDIIVVGPGGGGGGEGRGRERERGGRTNGERSRFNDWQLRRTGN